MFVFVFWCSLVASSSLLLLTKCSEIVKLNKKQSFVQHLFLVYEAARVNGGKPRKSHKLNALFLLLFSGGAAAPAAASESSATTTTTTTPASSEYKDIVYTLDSGVATIRFNRPTRKNAFTVNTYREVERALKQAGADPAVRVAVLTGTGDMYSSGNDLSNFLNIPEGGPEQLARESAKLLEDYVASYIHFPKLLVAAVNGPALGVAVTVLGLADVVFATDRATFKTPFTALGQSPEGCSSYVFPQIMGPIKANAMLLLGQELSAAEAERVGFVSQVLPHEHFHDAVHRKALEFAKLPPQSMQISKRLIRERTLGVLDEVNRTECKVLSERWLSEECMNAIMAFMARKQK
ncbi:hypothetical protein, variant [Capsaspora owczarzaki ATCC 30864]|uniref:hypothetical protein, variant n=1 Tax=Capsaspora owczarzaki (strain ATCC 30864) TaxID=595528 RepID=UPI0003525E05|nr:hypothetical protein, variant [Capsaspora owczarzaki ATCC 30864]|eukprot:XP_011270516.1 hypothetical protein, variant [Capsaspora owczarzaki ATCC 30864]